MGSLEERNGEHTCVQRLLVDLQGEPSNVADSASIVVGVRAGAVTTHRSALAYREIIGEGDSEKTVQLRPKIRVTTMTSV